MCIDKQPKFSCHVCGDVFGSKAARASHCSRVHGLAGLFSHVRGSICWSCGTEYHSTSRLRLHLRKVALCGVRHLESDLSYSPWKMTEAAHLQELPAIKVPFAQPFWARLHPIRASTCERAQHAVCNEVLCFHYFRNCSDFQQLVQTVLSLARSKPQVLEGAKLAFCAFTVELNQTQEALLRGLFSLKSLGDHHSAICDDCQMLVTNEYYCYGPYNFDYQQLGRSFTFACA